MSGQDQQNIILYIQGKLDKQSAQLFEERLEQEEELKSEYEFYKDIEYSIGQKKLIESVSQELESDGFFEKSNSEKTSSDEKPPVKLKPRRIFLRYAATFLLLGAASLFIWTNIQYSNAQLSDLRITDIQRLGDLGSLKGGNNTLSSLQLGLKAIQEARFNDAVQQFERVLNTSQDFPASQLYLSFAQMKLKNYGVAQNVLEPLTEQTDDTLLKQKAEWLSLQIRLRMDNLDQVFFNDLQEISNNQEHPFQENAIQLEKKLNSNFRKLVL